MCEDCSTVDVVIGVVCGKAVVCFEVVVAAIFVDGKNVLVVCAGVVGLNISAVDGFGDVPCVAGCFEVGVEVVVAAPVVGGENVFVV